MGNTLSFPDISKHSTSGGNARLLYSTTGMQGWRLNMEDADAAELSLDEGVENSNTFFAVYDGHGGRKMSTFAAINVHKRLVTEEAYREKRYAEALKSAFLGTDKDFLADTANAKDSSGCTAIAALVTGDDKIYAANAGDSRCVLSVKGKVKPLSVDQKPSDKIEKDRILAAGGYIKRNRVNGNLALSRALGDFKYKKNKSLIPEKQIITANPEVAVHDITDEDEFLVLACDGIWDCMSSQQVVDFVRLKISEGQELSEIGEMLCNHCLGPDGGPPTDSLPCKGCAKVYCNDCKELADSGRTGDGCDNMTVIIVAILNGRTKDEWYSWITDRVKDSYGYKTPRSLPQIYEKSRLKSFEARRKWEEERDGPYRLIASYGCDGKIFIKGGPSGLHADRFRSALAVLLDK